MKFLHHLLCRPILGLILLLGMSSANAVSVNDTKIQSLDVKANGDNMCLTSITPKRNNNPNGPTYDIEKVIFGLMPCDPMNRSGVNQVFSIDEAGFITGGVGGYRYCLALSSKDDSSAKAGDKIIPRKCKPLDKWKYENSSLTTPSGNWCMSWKAGGLTIDKCGSIPDRKWKIIGGGLKAPAVPAGIPIAKVPNTTLSNAQISTLVHWINSETRIAKTAFCWRKPDYYRPAGIVPSNCSGDKINGLCYDKCPAGMDRMSALDPTCAKKCDEGFERTGVRTCFRPFATRAAHFEGCKKDYKALGLTCTHKTQWWKTYSRKASCDNGFVFNGTSCTREAATRSLDTKEASYRIQTCNNGQYKEAGLCYDHAKTGYTCTAMNCTTQCASGTVSCGPSACARNLGTCTAAEVDMVVSPALMLSSLATGGAVGAGAKLATAVKKAELAVEASKDIAEIALILKDAINDFMAAAEKDLASISTDDIAYQMDQTYGKDSPNYKTVAREYALLQIMMTLSDLQIELAKVAITTADFTGVLDTINAFAKPPCKERTAIPNFNK